MHKKNLLELCLSPDLGGLELYMVRAAKALHESLHVTSVINAKGKLEQYYKETEYPYEMLEKKSNLFMFGAAKKLAKIIDENKIDIVHLHWTKDIPIAVLAKKLSTCKPKLVQTRNMTMTRFKDDFYHRILYRNIDLMLPVTYQVKEQLETFIPEDIRPKIEVLYMGSDKPELLSNDEITQKRHEFEMDDQFVVGMVGRINEAKGQHLLIQAVAKLDNKDIHAYFVGHEMKKGYTDTLKEMAQELGVSERVHFLGFMKNPHHFYQMCDAVVLASKRETFGLVLIEAMQVGTAVIGSNSGGVVEIIDDHESGLLFEKEDAQSLATSIKTLYSDTILRERIATAGMHKALDKFSSETQFKALENILNSMHTFVSIIVPTYKDLIALDLILEALTTQTYQNFEVIIAEDDESEESKTYLENITYDLSIKHFSHEDDGNRKAIIINKALPHISGEYIVFIDGDVVPYSTFIESHLALSRPKTVLCGRRVNLGDKVSSDLREGKITALKLEQNFLKNYRYITNDNSRHYEQGFRFNPTSKLYRWIQSKNKNAHILGSNFSCFKEDLFAINGFDEDIPGTSKDDVDLEWRFLDSGCNLVSCKYCANLFHLNHNRNSRVDIDKIAQKIMKQNREAGKFVCSNGLEKKIL
jgi:glycosyltransferase involved in cell wall biosynthesis